MKYTEKDIPGIVFLGPKERYICLRLEGKNVVMGKEDKPGYEFKNTIEVTLYYFNNGTWKVINNNNYEIY